MHEKLLFMGPHAGGVQQHLARTLEHSHFYIRLTDDYHVIMYVTGTSSSTSSTSTPTTTSSGGGEQVYTGLHIEVGLYRSEG